MAGDVPRVALQPAGGAVDYVETLLERNNLPAADVRPKSDCFYVASVDGDRVGVGGIERFGADGLLRSLVVARSARGNGYGTAIRAELEAEARSEAVETLYLLTTTAADFFTTAGYTRIDRSEAPESVRDTTEFVDLCPASAVCMRKPL